MKKGNEKEEKKLDDLREKNRSLVSEIKDLKIVVKSLNNKVIHLDKMLNPKPEPGKKENKSEQEEEKKDSWGSFWS